MSDPINAALISEPGLTEAALALLPRDALLLSDHALGGLHRLPWAEAALDVTPIDAEEVYVRLRALMPRALVVDMGWVLASQQGVTGLEQWGGIADRIALDFGVTVVSVYDRETVIEEQLQAAMRAHRQFLAPSGYHANPYWIPAAMLESAPLDAQLDFMLGRVVPDYAGLSRTQAGQMFARGATPSWLGPRRPGLGSQPGPGRWHIHCLGQLRVFIHGKRVDWRLPGWLRKRRGRCLATCCNRAKRAPMQTRSASFSGPRARARRSNAQGSTTPSPCCAKRWERPMP